MTNFGSKCATCAGGLGILLCSVLMSMSVVGAGVVALSKNADNGNVMGNMGSMITAKVIDPQSNSLYILVTFFSGFWGEVILIVSFSLMLLGMWFTGKRKIIPLAFLGVLILYVSMYSYYSVTLEVIGAILLSFAYLSIYNYKVAKVVKLV
ncbi:MAG: hypothetical protein M3044_20705 [Thermoproteota archaeon]|nr:hypothetical protein [Thermoproteota archaeon]